MNVHLMLILSAFLWLEIGLSTKGAEAAENPYSSIVTRNVFGLVPIPTGPAADATPATPPPKITPNGIMNLFGKLQALFKVANVAKAGQPAKEESYVLAEGERQDDIEVQKIDEKAGKITFNNHGEIQELPLVLAAAGGGAPPPTTPPGMPMPRPVMPTANPLVGGNATTVIGNGAHFGRNPNVPGAGNSGIGTPGLGGTVNNSIYSPAANQEPQMTPEQRIIMIEAQRQKYLQEGNPIGHLLPPTAYTPQPNNGGEGNDSGQ